MPRRDAVIARAVQAVGQYQREAEALRGELLQELAGQRRLALVDVAWLEAAAWLEEAERQRAGDAVAHPVGIDRDDAVGQRVDSADVLTGGVVGRLPLLAVPCLVTAAEKGALAQRLTRQLQPPPPPRL